MIFLVQRYLEDYFNRRALDDPDQYAVAVANLYSAQRHALPDRRFRERLHRVRTAFFKANPQVHRAAFEKEVLEALDTRFQKRPPPACGSVLR